MCGDCNNCTCSHGVKEHMPYTIPYTGSGAVHTPNGWVSSRVHGANGAISGPGPESRKGSGASASPPAFHYAEPISHAVPPPPGAEKTAVKTRRQSSPRNIDLHGGDQDIDAIKGPGGVGFDLPKQYEELNKVSNDDVALKIAQLNIKKGRIHNAMVRTAQDPKILSCNLEQQMDIRDENKKMLKDVNEAIRAWEAVQTRRIESLPNPSIVDTLMNSQDHYYEADEDKDE